MKKGIGLALLSAALFAAAPASAQNLDDKIKAMEQELTQLKEQQVELKKEATAAAAALPNFSYRPGGGLNIEAADKAWSINFGLEGHMRMLFESGKDQAGRTNGEVMGRRFRPQFVYCINNCFYEIQARLDLDGFGTNSNLQRGQMAVHFEQINPWLPTLRFGMDSEMAVSLYRQGSGNFGAQAEYDLLSRNNGLNTGRYGNGFTLGWDDIDIGSGRAQFMFGVATFGEGDDGLSSNTDRKDFAAYLRVEPFTKMKNKWIEGLGFEVMGWWCNDDPRVVTPAGSTTSGNQSACRRSQVQDHGDGGRQTLYQFTPTNTTGRGTQPYYHTGMGWRIGPYWLRATRDYQDYNWASNRPRQGVDAKARNFLIAHDLFLWSPKGFLTGDSTIPGSVLVGTHFERNDFSCGRSNCAAGGEFSRNRILLREWDLWYFLPNRISVGGSVLWYDASNVRSGRNSVGDNLGCGAGHRGDSCNWTDVMLNFRMYF
jgi:hypothetical protein